MSSVTQRISQIKQPYGGYLPIKNFSKINLNDGISLNESENVHSSLIGMTVDYLTRYLMGASVDEAFHISCLGAEFIGMLTKAILLKDKIKGLDDLSIISACKLVGFDVCYRSCPSSYKPIEDINPDPPTIENIRTMVNRCLSFWEQYGPIILSEFTFEGGYTSTVNSGDGDFLTANAMWDLKVSKSTPTSKHSLQLLMYYVMGLHSVHTQFQDISYLGIFNPRLNIAYIYPTSSISAEMIAEIENDVLCYTDSLDEFKEAEECKDTLPSSEEEELYLYLGEHIFEPNDTPPIEYTVSEFCEIYGFKKNIVYQDIRSGRLFAYRRGNRYVIPHDTCFNYVERKKAQQKIQIIIPCIGMFFMMLIILLLLSESCGSRFYL